MEINHATGSVRHVASLQTAASYGDAVHHTVTGFMLKKHHYKQRLVLQWVVCVCEPLFCLNMKTYEWLLKGSVRSYSRESGGSHGTVGLHWSKRWDFDECSSLDKPERAAEWGLWDITNVKGKTKIWGIETLFMRKHTGITLKYPNISFLQINKYASFHIVFKKLPLEGDSRPARKTSFVFQSQLGWWPAPFSVFIKKKKRRCGGVNWVSEWKLCVYLREWTMSSH